jgi:hypothetical protein
MRWRTWWTWFFLPAMPDTIQDLNSTCWREFALERV